MECWCNRKLALDEDEILEHIKGCNYYLRRCHFLNILDKILPESSESDYRVISHPYLAYASGAEARREGTGCPVEAENEWN